MQVVGVTTQQEVYVVSRERKFRVNEILIIGVMNPLIIPGGKWWRPFPTTG